MLRKTGKDWDKYREVQRDVQDCAGKPQIKQEEAWNDRSVKLQEFKGGDLVLVLLRCPVRSCLRSGRGRIV